MAEDRAESRSRQHRAAYAQAGTDHPLSQAIRSILCGRSRACSSRCVRLSSKAKPEAEYERGRSSRDAKTAFLIARNLFSFVSRIAGEVTTALEKRALRRDAAVSSSGTRSQSMFLFLQRAQGF
eukprot:1603594-Rhodomonas_salina.3